MDVLPWLLGFVFLMAGVLFFFVWVALRPRRPEVQREEKRSEASSELLEASLQSPEALPSQTSSLSGEVGNTSGLDSGSSSLPMADSGPGFWSRLAARLQGLDAKQNLDVIEEALYTSDLGVATVERLMDSLRAKFSRSERGDLALLKSSLAEEFTEIFSSAGIPEPEASVLGLLQKPRPLAVWMIVGVNGAGKTTTIGKLSGMLAQMGHKVLVAAGDTFRAAAGAQLQVWTERAQVEIFSPEGVNDPSAVAYDAIAKARARGFDVVLVDTAGRLHTQVNLMEELKKMKRVMAKVDLGFPHEVLLVLDSNSGQNALHQAREFHRALGVTGVVLTKMDGTAKGGVALAISHELKIPVRLLGVGEKIVDLKAFSPKKFVHSLLQEGGSQ